MLAFTSVLVTVTSLATVALGPVAGDVLDDLSIHHTDNHGWCC